MPLGTPRLEMGSNDLYDNIWDLVTFSIFETKIEKITEIKKIYKWNEIRVLNPYV